ncbi:peptidase M12 [Pseudomonas moraviensis subsp. stanleyae]|uniref:M12 family metallopeptidase n=1 Tax=Pseudomonas moraviensis TaxID=321662 RepID=UPI002E30B73D|nr:M12 family metallopeptidase [Pseudomonas moraviensis]MED7670492.1 peptidase M12 [Pseudomonas moraviensis subsp. stanleyae]
MHTYPFVKMRSHNFRPGERQKRSIACSNRLWDNASEVTFSFMENLPDESAYRIERIIRQWEPFVSLTFAQVEKGQGQIRIALDGDENWSAIGTEALEFDREEPTLVIQAALQDPSFEATLLHEFGHALGFHHAHLHPDANIPWNIEAVHLHFKETQGWNDEEIELNIFRLDSCNNTFDEEYDSLSIMHYPVPNFMTHGNFEIAFNMKLSERDKRLARQSYPAIDYRTQII